MNIEYGKTIEFRKIRIGTVFEADDMIYLKGKYDGMDEVAVNLVTGSVFVPDEGEKWDHCRLYPKASIKI